MKILLANINDITDKYGLECLNKYSDKIMSNKNKQLEHSVGRFILALGLKYFYNIDEYKITINENGKPEIDKNINFSISHSENYVIVGFSDKEIGVDIEFIRPRDFNKILKHYGIEKNVTEIEFYQIWTDYEARYKSGLSNIQSKNYQKNNYIFSISSIDNKVEIYETQVSNTIDIIPAEYIELETNQVKIN